MKKFTEEAERWRRRKKTKTLLLKFCNISPPCRPAMPFYFPFGHLLNSVESLIACRAEPIYLCSPLLPPPPLSFLKAVINIINI